MNYYTPYWLGHIAILISIISALSYPVFGYLFSNILFVMMTSFLPSYGKDRDHWCLMFLFLALGIGVTSFLQRFVFGLVGENMTHNIRKKLYSSIIHKHIAWFDSKNRATGILRNIISEDI